MKSECRFIAGINHTRILVIHKILPSALDIFHMELHKQRQLGFRSDDEMHDEMYGS